MRNTSGRWIKSQNIKSQRGLTVIGVGYLNHLSFGTRITIEELMMVVVYI